jgi:5,10-methylenetetrahydromethanopterin reductase
MYAPGSSELQKEVAMGRLGVVLPPDLPSHEVRDFIWEADELGFDELWVVEDCFLRGGIAQAAVALTSTNRIHIGIGVLPAGARNPAFAAMELATLADLFPGRVTVGVGHGMPDWMRQVGAWPASPVTLLREYLTALRRLLDGDVATTETDGANRYVQLRDVQLARPPADRPMIFAGVRGEKSLAAVSDIADGILLAEPVTPEYLRAVRDAASTGPAGQQVAAYHVAAVDVDGESAVSTARAGLQWIGDPAWRANIKPLPFADEFASLQESSSSREAFVEALPDSWVRQLAICGTAAEARLRITELAAAGCTHNILIPVGGTRALASLATLLPG